MRSRSPATLAVDKFLQADIPSVRLGSIARPAFLPRSAPSRGSPVNGVAAVDGAKMRAPAGLKNIAGDERLARGIAYIETEIDYYLDRLDIIDETVSQGFENHDCWSNGSRAILRSVDVGRTRSNFLTQIKVEERA